MDVPSDLIGPNEAASILHVNRITIRRMIERGELTGYRVTSGLTKVSEAEVRKLINRVPLFDHSLESYVQRVIQRAQALTPDQRARLRDVIEVRVEQA